MCLLLRRAENEKDQKRYLSDFTRKKMSETLRKRSINTTKKESFRSRKNTHQTNLEEQMSPGLI